MLSIQQVSQPADMGHELPHELIHETTRPQLQFGFLEIGGTPTPR